MAMIPKQRKLRRYTESAAHILRESDINTCHNVALAWDNYHKYYLPECLRLMERAVKEVATINVPRHIVKLYRIGE